MTWVKLPDDALEDPRVVEVPPESVLAYLGSLGWSNRWARDGRIPSAMAGVHAEAWVAAGLAHPIADGVQLVWLLEHQPTAEEIRHRRKGDAERQARRRRHNAGDHATCDPQACRVLKATSRRDTVRDTPRESKAPDPTFPDPTRREGRGGEGGDGAGLSAAVADTDDRIAGSLEVLATASFSPALKAARRQLEVFGWQTTARVDDMTDERLVSKGWKAVGATLVKAPP